MIASLRGTVIDIGLNAAVLECCGVGYRVIATPRTLARLTRGEDAFILTTLAVKEDSMTLYGFTESSDQEMFTVLQKVSGFGPKLAMTALSVLNAQELASAIANGESKSLQRIPGLGNGVAERLIVELKDKVAAWQPAEAELEFAGTQTSVGEAADFGALGVAEHVVEALVGLGFSDKQAKVTVDRVLAEDPEANSSQTLRAALAKLGPQ